MIEVVVEDDCRQTVQMIPITRPLIGFTSSPNKAPAAQPVNTWAPLLRILRPKMKKYKKNPAQNNLKRMAAHAKGEWLQHILKTSSHVVSSFPASAEPNVVVYKVSSEGRAVVSTGCSDASFWFSRSVMMKIPILFFLR
jgi:hypothetical protein